MNPMPAGTHPASSLKGFSMQTAPSFRLSAIAACASAAALLAACGGGGGDGGTPTTVQATVSGATVTNAQYSQTALITVNGANLDRGLTVTSAGCKAAPTLSTTAPTVSTATTAYYTCTIGSVGAQTAAIARTADGAALTSVAYTVAVPQVTLTMGGGATGSIVITLEPTKAPITTDNFLAYVKSGFYVGTAYHRSVNNFVVQGGGYAGPITATATPTLKPTNAAITLEDNAGLLNQKYTLAMARTNVPDSATSQFFINMANNTFLDRTATARGYAVFGTITSGTAVADAMAAATCTASTTGYSECVPIPNITITAAAQTR
jgi:cyclophilin family peptidyl-prolyl cis-trans isomerase